MITVKNEQDVLRQTPTGFSWTNLFFGFLVPLFRGDMKGMCIQLILALATANISALVFPFYYNKMFIRSLYREGYKPNDSDAEEYFIVNQIIPFQA